MQSARRKPQSQIHQTQERISCRWLNISQLSRLFLSIQASLLALLPVISNSLHTQPAHDSFVSASASFSLLPASSIQFSVLDHSSAPLLSSTAILKCSLWQMPQFVTSTKSDSVVAAQLIHCQAFCQSDRGGRVLESWQTAAQVLGWLCLPCSLCACTQWKVKMFDNGSANCLLLVLVFPGEGVPDWPYYPVLAKFLEGRTEFGDSYDAGSHSYTEPEARPGASHHHPGKFCVLFVLFFQFITYSEWIWLFCYLSFRYVS